jgi:hypothetical protein
MIVSNVCFGSSFVLYNAYLQLLADDHSAVVALPEGPAREAKREEVMSSISAKGCVLILVVDGTLDSRNAIGLLHAGAEPQHSCDPIKCLSGDGPLSYYVPPHTMLPHQRYAWGYLGGLVVLIITFPAVFFLPPVEAYTVIIIVSGIWWLCWSMYDACFRSMILHWKECHEVSRFSSA